MGPVVGPTDREETERPRVRVEGLTRTYEQSKDRT